MKMAWEIDIIKILVKGGVSGVVSRITTHCAHDANLILIWANELIQYTSYKA